MVEESPQLITTRYASEGLLGSGGAGDVYRVRDRATGKLLALKRLRTVSSEQKQGDLALLFEREYHTLAQLGHPGIVEVYDYGVASGEPYYTMELLDGRDLRELAPLPWREACRLLCEVASALALLHSRRLVHRDLTPRNVRRTAAGRAKLLDFGAMMPMGASRQLVGTPGYVAPEQASCQELDARSDLFGFGALAYWTLTRRHAFRARTFDELADAWRTRPPAPSAVVADIPADLDALVLSLLSLDPAGRPASAADVIARLRALTDQPGDEAPEHAHAYLITPMLVGRTEAMVSLRRQLMLSARGRGAAIVIEGAPGMGRSRLLAALVLEAKLAGALVLRADADDARGGEYELVRRLVDRLVEVAPERARESAKPYAAALAPTFPQLGIARRSPPSLLAATGSVLDALVSWFCELSRQQTLCIAIDDLLRADAASIAFIARLSAHVQKLPLTLAVTAESGGAHALQRALDQLEHNGFRIVLQPLDLAQHQSLLRSVFGDVPNLAPLADFIHELSGGRPGSCLELAQHLADRGIVRFANGSWQLPYKLDGLSLPSSYEQALEQRVAALQPCAHALLELMAVATRIAPLAIADHLQLLAPSFSHAQVFAALDEVVRERMIVQSDGHDRLRDPVLARVLIGSMSPQRLREVHAALAQHYERGGGTIGSVVSYHLLYAGEFQRSFELHRAVRSAAKSIADPNSVFDRTELGSAFLEQLYSTAQQRGFSPQELFLLRKHLIQLAAVANPDLAWHAEDVLPQLLRDSGHVYFHEHAELAPLDRIVACLQRAQARYDATPEAERGLPPVMAVRELAAMVGILTGVCARIMDTERAAPLPSLLRPFAPLSPLIEMVLHLTTNSVEAMLHATAVHEDRNRLFDQLSRPIEGLDEVTRLGAVQILTFYQGLDYATRGSAKALELAAELQKVDYYTAGACQVRVIYHAIHGDVVATRLAREQRETLAMLHVDAGTYLMTSAVHEVTLCYYGGDLVSCRRIMDSMAREAARYRGWRPWHAYATALVEALRGDHDAALQAIDRVFALSPEVGHAARATASPLQIELLARGPEPERAVRLGRELLARREAESRPLNSRLLLDLGLSLAETRTGDYASGAARLEQSFAYYEGFGGAALPLVLLDAQRARIALLAGDHAAFADYAERAARRAEGLRHPGLVARLQQLVSEARSANRPVSPQLLRCTEPTMAVTMTAVVSGSIAPPALLQLASEPQLERRAQLGLELLLERAGASGGYVFAVGPAGPHLLAALHMPAVDSTLIEVAAALVGHGQPDDEASTRVETAVTGSASRIDDCATQAVNVLSHRGRRLQAFLLQSAYGPPGLALLLAPEASLLRLDADLLRAVGDAIRAA